MFFMIVIGYYLASYLIINKICPKLANCSSYTLSCKKKETHIWISLFKKLLKLDVFCNRCFKNLFFEHLWFKFDKDTP